MGNAEIDGKLRKFLETHGAPSEECHVVYLMVELRKYITRKNANVEKNAFRLFIFYADWVVHSEKSFRHQDLNPTLDVLYAAAHNYETSGRLDQGSKVFLDQFAGMIALRQEMLEIFSWRNLPGAFIASEPTWKQFVRLLISILGDQPIDKIENSGLVEVRFNMVDQGTARFTLAFDPSIHGASTYCYDFPLE